MPTTIIINKNFKEAYRIIGYVDWQSKKYKTLIKDYYNFFLVQVRFKKISTNPTEKLKIGASSLFILAITFESLIPAIC